MSGIKFKAKEYGCLKCLIPNAGGGNIDNWKRKGINPNLTLLHKIKRYKIYKCNQCDSHFIHKGKIFDDCISSQLPALLNWSDSINFYHKNKTEIMPIFKNEIFDTLYSGEFEISQDGKTEIAIILIYDKPLSGDYYDPLKPIPKNAIIKFMRLNNVDEIKNKLINKYFVRHDEPILNK